MIEPCFQSLQRFYDLRGKLQSSHRLVNPDTNVLNGNADKPFGFGFFTVFFPKQKRNQAHLRQWRWHFAAFQASWHGPCPRQLPEGNLAPQQQGPHHRQSPPVPVPGAQKPCCGSVLCRLLSSMSTTHRRMAGAPSPAECGGGKSHLQMRCCDGWRLFWTSG